MRMILEFSEPESERILNALDTTCFFTLDDRNYNVIRNLRNQIREELYRYKQRKAGQREINDTSYIK